MKAGDLVKLRDGVALTRYAKFTAGIVVDVYRDTYDTFYNVRWHGSEEISLEYAEHIILLSRGKQNAI